MRGQTKYNTEPSFQTLCDKIVQNNYTVFCNSKHSKTLKITKK